MFRSSMAIGFLMLALSGCGSMRLVDSEVRSYGAQAALPALANYRFERLPSQQADDAPQARLEAMVQTALSQVGWQRNDAAASYSVQVAVSIKVDPYGPWYQTSSAWGPGWNMGWGVHSSPLLFRGGRGLPGWGLMEQACYWRELSLVMRDLSSAQVVYETHAAHDGPWTDSEAVLPAMFEAALQGFPNAPAGVRRVNIEIPR